MNYKILDENIRTNKPILDREYSTEIKEFVAGDKAWILTYEPKLSKT